MNHFKTSSFIRRENKILSALKNGRVPVGLQMYSHNADIIEILGITGFDYVMIDNEHVRLNPESLVNLIRASDAASVTPIVRVDENNPAKIRAAVESGALGVVVPHIRNAAEAKQAVQSCHYPPEGTCGVCPAIRSAKYAQENWAEYMEYSNENITLIALLEDVEGIENAEEIFAELKPGRDAVGIGLADLANSLMRKGESVDWDHPYLKEAKEKVMNLSQKTGIPVQGMVWPKSDIESAKKVIANGTKILLTFPDLHIIHEYCRNVMSELHDLSFNTRAVNN